jgi:hypothetical protein
MKKIITFSLWGDKPIYNIGAIKNAELAKKYYPNFECWYFIHIHSVPNNTIEELNKYSNVKIIFKDENILTCKPMMWRQTAIDDPDIEIMMSRDTDSRISIREKLAVDEWLNSDKLFHIMRDHPYHGDPIQGGMFGTRKNPKIPSWTNLIKDIQQNGERGYDQYILKTIFYPILKDDSMIHASFCIFPNEIIRPFPIDYDDEYSFVGEYINPDETGITEHRNVIKNELNKIK